MVIKMNIAINKRGTKLAVVVPMYELKRVCCKKCMEKINEPG